MLEDKVDIKNGIKLDFNSSDQQLCHSFIARGTPHLITAEDWEVIDLPSACDINNNPTYLATITKWHKKLLSEEDA